MIERARLVPPGALGRAWSQVLSDMFEEALAAVEPAARVRDALREEASPRAFAALDAPAHVLAIGKASVAMARGALEVLGARVVGGVVVHKAAREGALGPLALVRGAHPVPDERSRIAGSRVLQHARAVGPEARALVLISGGASSLVCAPRAPVTVQDLQSLTTSLLGAGADIHAINHIRRELDVIKGGGLARALARTRAHSLILADVDAARWEDVGSGPTAPRARDPAGAWATIERLGLASRVPPRVREALRVASPPGCPIEHPRTCVGAVEDAVAAARRVAARSGYRVVDAPAVLTGEARGLAPALARTLDDWTRDGGAPRCAVLGGETTVTLRGPGRGGRNQELALAVANELARLQARRGPAPREAVFATLATDGEDGPTDAAGAVVTRDTAPAIDAAGLDPVAALERNDSYPALEAAGALLRIGATGTNVRDLALLLAR